MFAAGYIVAPRVITVPEDLLPDLSGLRHIGGDFVIGEELENRLTKRSVMGSIPDHWKTYARGLPTMLFAATIKHSLALVEILTAAGIRTKHIDGGTKKAERERALWELKTGVIDILCQVGLFVEGLDMPELKCVILARPTESSVVFLQSCGRCMRPHNDIRPIILDHAGNCRRVITDPFGERRPMGLPTEDRQYTLETRKPKNKGEPAAPKFRFCKTCFEYFPMTVTECPTCGLVFSVGREVQSVPGDLVEVDATPAPSDEEKVKKACFVKWWLKAYKDGWAEDWVMRRYAEVYKMGPPTDWTQPPRPNVTYTWLEKKKFYNSVLYVAQRDGKPIDWIKKRYELRHQESMDLLFQQETEENETVSAEKAVKVAVEVELAKKRSEPKEELEF